MVNIKKLRLDVETNLKQIEATIQKYEKEHYYNYPEEIENYDMEKYYERKNE